MRGNGRQCGPDPRFARRADPRVHIATSGGRFHAIRFSTAWDTDERVHNTVPRPRMLAEPSVREAYRCLGRFGLTFDAWVYHPQLSEAAELAAKFPDTPIVLNHFGSPILGGPNAGRPAEVFAEWRSGMAALASHQNVHVKLGGFRFGAREPRAGRSSTAFIGGDRYRMATLLRSLRRTIRRRPLHVREQFSGAKALVQLCSPMERVQASGGGRFHCREVRAVRRHRRPSIPPRLKSGRLTFLSSRAYAQAWR